MKTRRNYLRICIYIIFLYVFAYAAEKYAMHIILYISQTIQTMGGSAEAADLISVGAVTGFIVVVGYKCRDWLGLSKKKDKKSPPSDESGDDCQS